MNTSFRPVVSFHPGKTLEEKLKEMNLTISEFSNQSQVPEVIVEGVVHGNISVSADMALAFEHVTHIPAHYWLNAQHNFDEYVLRAEATTYTTRLAAFKKSFIQTISNSLTATSSGKIASMLA